MAITKIIQLIVLLAICENITARVRRFTDGEPISIQEAPYFVSIRHGCEHICVGTLITPKCVLTAAHWLLTSENIDVYNVTVVSGADQKNSDGNCHMIKKIRTHHSVITGFKEIQQPDIAIIYLFEAVDYDTMQYGIDLPNKEPNYRANAVFIGFPYQSAVLHRFKTMIAPSADCYHPENKLNGLPVHGTLCGLHDVLHGRGEGNGGAPLFQDGTLIGIASVQSADSVFDIYTNVYEHTENIIREILIDV